MLIRLLLLVLLLVLPVLSHATTYYAAPSGGGSCSAAQNSNTLIQSLPEGLKCMSSGDTLILKCGIYQESIYGPPGSSQYPTVPNGSPGNPSIVRSETQYCAVLQPDHGHSTGGNIIYLIDNHDITIDGLTIDMSRLNCGNGSGAALGGPNTGNMIFQNNEVKNMCGPGNPNGANGVALGGQLRSGASFTVKMANNLVHDLAYGFNEPSEIVAMGYYLVGDHGIVENNTFWNIGGYCGESWSSGSSNPPVTNDLNIFRNNVCYNSGGIGMLFSSGSDSIMYNNIIYNVSTNPNISHVGLYFGNAGLPSNHYQAYNNTIYAGVGKCIVIGDKHNNAVVRNNICWQNGGGSLDIIEDQGSGSIINTNLCNPSGSTGGAIACPLYTTPSFVNAGAADFHLATGSAAIGQGANLSSVFTTDQAGTTRTVPWDLGALKAGGGGVPAPTNLPMISITNP